MKSPFALLAAALTLTACSPDNTPDTRETAADLETNSDAVASLNIIPAAFHGSFDSDGGDCDATDEFSLVIEAERMKFYESSGTVSTIESEGQTADVTLNMSGEGEQWTSAYQITLSESGETLSLVGEGMAEPVVRQRCAVGA